MSADSCRCRGSSTSLQPLARRVAGLLSGGEQRMLAMARAPVSDPKVLPVDKLSLGLGPIIVEHHVQMASDVARRGDVLSNGTVRLAGSAGDPSR